MLQQNRPKRELIEGTPALIMIDIQGELFAEGEPGPIPEMPNFGERMALARKPIDKAHEGALRAMEYLQTGARRSLDETLEAIEAYQAAA